MTSPPFWQLRSYTDGGQHYDGQIGAEPTPQEYIASLVDCTREWARVLKPSGSLFVELGDKYATRYSSLRGGGRAGLNDDDDSRGRSGQNRSGVGEKCLLDLPARYSIACVDQLGLIKRANIVWHHVNGLPESCNDRVRVAHSMVFHFTRLPRYYAAVDEIREPHTGPAFKGRAGVNAAGWQPDTQAWRDGGKGFVMRDREYNPLGKLPGSVWEIPSAPLVVPERLGVDHFAAYPPELCRRIIAGWSPPGICTACGEGRRPVVARHDERPMNGWPPGHGASTRLLNGVPGASRPSFAGSITGYACACPQPDAPTRPAVVLDPFAGTGTTMLVASVLGRVGVGVDRSMDYARLARWRTRDPGERARALGVPKPPPVPDGQGSLFDDLSA